MLVLTERDAFVKLTYNKPPSLKDPLQSQSLCQKYCDGEAQYQIETILFDVKSTFRFSPVGFRAPPVVYIFVKKTLSGGQRYCDFHFGQHSLL